MAMSNRIRELLVIPVLAGVWLITAAAHAQPLAAAEGWLPARVHVFEDYETEIEKRWWLRGTPETKDLPPSLSASLPNRRVCRAAPSGDFDDLMGDPKAQYRAVVFNPVPGPPMGSRTRLSFRYWFDGPGELRVQIYSLTNGYHRRVTLPNPTRKAWTAADIDMTQLRRPNGSGGALAENERIDDIQFYVSPEAELLIDDIVLYEAARDERAPFPRRIIFTGWFDTGQQGSGKEWPGSFEIVPHEAPRTWKAARSVRRDEGGSWIRVGLRGERALSRRTALRFDYLAKSAGPLEVVLASKRGDKDRRAQSIERSSNTWQTANLSWNVEDTGALAEEIQFLVADGSELLVDNVLLYEPAQVASNAKP